MKNMNGLLRFSVFVFLLLLIACDKPASVTVGTQTWMTKNLDVTHFQNGDPIPVCKDFAEWERLGEAGLPACAAYDFDRRNRKKFGLLYNWYAVSDPRGLAPEGFRVPMVEDFLELLFVTGGRDPYDSQKAALALTDGGSSGFNARFGGWGCTNADPDIGMGTFNEMGYNAAFWTSSENGPSVAWNLEVGATLRSDTGGAYLDGSSMKSLLFSVRCIQIEQIPDTENDQ
ncbi:MAG: fibrobacter succinogenes major paralogous domain-containing protein [FCB group bacterium]|nr:fibrobacter succinogenes major paralogous domain-containing protein [FCB group bacterium]